MCGQKWAVEGGDTEHSLWVCEKSGMGTARGGCWAGSEGRRCRVTGTNTRLSDEKTREKQVKMQNQLVVRAI